MVERKGRSNAGWGQAVGALFCRSMQGFDRDSCEKSCRASRSWHGSVVCCDAQSCCPFHADSASVLIVARSHRRSRIAGNLKYRARHPAWPQRASCMQKVAPKVRSLQGAQCTAHCRKCAIADLSIYPERPDEPAVTSRMKVSAGEAMRRTSIQRAGVKICEGRFLRRQADCCRSRQSPPLTFTGRHAVANKRPRCLALSILFRLAINSRNQWVIQCMQAFNIAGS